MSDLVGSLRNAASAARRYGVMAYAWRLGKRLRQKVYKHKLSTVFQRDLVESVELLEAKVPIDVRPFTDDQWTELYAFLGQYQPPASIDTHFGAGWRPMLGYHAGRLIGVSWFSAVPIYVESIELRLDYGLNCGYIEDTRTDDSMHGKGVAPAIRSHICRHLRDIGCRRVFVCVGDDNAASQAVARKCAFVPYESVTLTRFLWFRRHERIRTNRQ